MKYPNFVEEKKLWKQGYNLVAGLDEAGRGPLAGPVVAAAVVFDALKFQALKLKFKDIKDSKQLSAKKRDYFYKVLTNHSGVNWGIGVVSEKIIDKINILEATKLAMKKAVADLGFAADFLILDGNFKINLKVPQMTVIKADEKVFSVGAASIIAKVARDNLMIKIHKKYPNYGFNKHKGYGTKFHMEMLEKFGPLVIHRKSFAPVSKVLEYNNLKSGILF